MELDGKTTCPWCDGLGYLKQGAEFAKEGDITEVPPSCPFCKGSGEIDVDKVPLYRLTHLVAKEIVKQEPHLQIAKVREQIVTNISAGFNRSNVRAIIDLDGSTVFSDDHRKGDDYLNQLIKGPQGFLDEAKTILGQ